MERPEAADARRDRARLLVDLDKSFMMYEYDMCFVLNDVISVLK